MPSNDLLRSSMFFPDNKFCVPPMEIAAAKFNTALETYEGLLRKSIYDWTRNYLLGLFDDEDLLAFNVRLLADSAYDRIVKSIHHYYNGIIALEDSTKSKIERWIINDETPQTDEDDLDFGDSPCEEIKYDFVDPLFFEKYPVLHKFANLIQGLKKGDYPNGDCMCGSKIEDLNRIFNRELYCFAWTMATNS